MLLLPSVPPPVTLTEACADVRGANAILGTYTNFGNLMDLVALAVPMGGIGGGGGGGGEGLGCPGGSLGSGPPGVRSYSWGLGSGGRRRFALHHERRCRYRHCRVGGGGGGARRQQCGRQQCGRRQAAS